MHVCLMDRDGRKLVHANIEHNDFACFFKPVVPCRHDLTDTGRSSLCWLTQARIEVR